MGSKATVRVYQRIYCGKIEVPEGREDVIEALKNGHEDWVHAWIKENENELIHSEVTNEMFETDWHDGTIDPYITFGGMTVFCAVFEGRTGDRKFLQFRNGADDRKRPAAVLQEGRIEFYDDMPIDTHRLEATQLSPSERGFVEAHLLKHPELW